MLNICLVPEECWNLGFMIFSDLLTAMHGSFISENVTVQAILSIIIKLSENSLFTLE